MAREHTNLSPGRGEKYLNHNDRVASLYSWWRKARRRVVVDWPSQPPLFGLRNGRVPRMHTRALFASFTIALALGCSGTGTTDVSGSGGVVGTGGTGGKATSPPGGASTAMGGTAGSPTGGTQALGGTTSAAGSPAIGGSQPAGGSKAVGGATSSSIGGATTGGSNATIGGSKATGGTPTNGGATTATGGGKANGGTTATGGSKTVGGTSATDGATAAGGAPTTGGTTTVGGCDAGTTTTTWASNCPTAPPTTCTAGTWVAGGPQSDTCCSAMTLRSESAHFAVYGDESSTTAALAQSAVDHLETVWSLYFGNPLYMREPFCNSATKYKANIHVHSDWGLTGGSFGTGRMGMWIGTGGLSDHWGLAHEFMHGVQSVEGGMACNQSNTCGWIYESHANWAAQQQTEYHTSDVHCSEMLANAPHLYLGSTRDRYCNWQFMEYLKDKYCFSAVNAIWTGTAAADPFTGIRNAMSWSVAQLNDFMGEWAMHNVTWDYQDPQPQGTAGGNQGTLYRSKYGLTTATSPNERRLRLTKVETLDTDYANNRRFISPYSFAPQRYGYNIIRLYSDSGATSVTVTFRGVTSAPSSPGWRWGLVAADSGLTKARYSALQNGSDGALTFCINSGESLFLVVTATPSAWYNIVWDQAYNTVPRYPYMIQLAGAWPEGFQNGTQDACPSGTVRIANGGGCGPSGLASTVYVGPNALVTGSGVSGAARIQDHAQVLGGKVTGGTVGALTILGSSFTVSGSSTQAMTTFYPLDFFEGRSLTGGALIGDVELRSDRSSGTCSGFVDGSTCTGPGTDSTPAPPYTWRP